MGKNKDKLHHKLSENKVIPFAKYDGFTIVELLIVVVVIAILAAITIISYNGITRQAIESSIDTDLHAAAVAVENDKTTTGSYPGSSGAANNNQGLKVSGNNTLSYSLNGDIYCISISNPGFTEPKRIKGGGQITNGTCIPTVYAFVGSGTNGHADGTGAAAQLSLPSSIAIDAEDTLYVTSRHSIRKITSSGVVTTVAGDGATSGFADGPAGTARFNYPRGLAVGNDGTIYVADRGNHSIRKITPAGQVITIAGTNTSGRVNATGSAARFYSPTAIALDAAENIYVVDMMNGSIRRVTQAGVVTTFAGQLNGFQGYTDGTGNAAYFRYPEGLVSDATGNLYVADSGGSIRKITPGAVVTTIAGVGGQYDYVDAAGTNARFYQPYSITIDTQGSLYVTEWGNATVRKITGINNEVTTILGISDNSFYRDGPASNALMGTSASTVFDSKGRMYIADQTYHRIRMFDF